MVLAVCAGFEDEGAFAKYRDLNPSAAAILAKLATHIDLVLLGKFSVGPLHNPQYVPCCDAETSRKLIPAKRERIKKESMNRMYFKRWRSYVAS